MSPAGKPANTIGGPTAYTSVSNDINVMPGPVTPISVSGPITLQDPVNVRFHRTASEPTLDQAGLQLITARTRSRSFDIRSYHKREELVPG